LSYAPGKKMKSSKPSSIGKKKGMHMQPKNRCQIPKNPTQQRVSIPTTKQSKEGSKA